MLECFSINYYAYDDEDKAVALADEKIEQCRVKFPYIVEEFPDILSKADPKGGSEFYFVHNKGKNSTQRYEHTQDFSMEGDPSKRPLADALSKQFLDNFGDMEAKPDEEEAEETPQQKLQKKVVALEELFKKLQMS